MKIYDIKIKHYTGKCFIQLAKYGNGRTAIKLMDAKDGMPICVATVNMPEIELTSSEMIIKDYSENEGVFDWLIKNKIIESIGVYADNGYVQCPVAKFHESFDKEE